MMNKSLYARLFCFYLLSSLLLACQPIEEITPTITLTRLAAAPTSTLTPTITPLPNTPTPLTPIEEMELPDFPTRTPVPTSTFTPAPTPTRPQPLPGSVLPSPIIYQTGGQINAVAAAGNLAYVGVGPRLYILDMTDPANPQVVGVSGMLPGVIEDLVVGDGVIYAAAGESGLWVIDVTDAAAPQPLYQLPATYQAGEMLLYEQTLFWLDQLTDAQSPEETGAFIHAFDITNPVQPSLNQTLVFSKLVASFVMVEEILFVKMDNNYVNGDYLMGFDTTDMQNLRQLFLLPDVEGRYMAVSGQELYLSITGGFIVFDISEPVQPVEIVRDTDMLYPQEPIASLAVYKGILFFTIGSCDEAHCMGGLQNVRRGLSEAFEPISDEWTAWLTRDLFLSENLAYVAAGSALYMIDIAENGLLNQIGQFNSPGYGGDLASDGQSMYMLDYHTSVVNAFDLSIPQQPVWRQQFFSSHYLTDIAVGGGYFYLATYWESLRIAQIDDSPELIVLASIPNDQAIENTQNPLYVNGLIFAEMNGRLAVIDVTDPLRPVILNKVSWPPLSGPSYKPLVWENDTLYTSDYDTFVILDVLYPADPVVVGQLDVALEICDADSQNGLAFLVAGACFEGSPYSASRLEIVRVSQPQEMIVVGSLELFDPMKSVIVIGDYTYVANGDVLVVDVSDPSRPQLVTTITTPGYASDLLTADGLLYVADQAGGLLVIQPFE